MPICERRPVLGRLATVLALALSLPVVAGCGDAPPEEPRLARRTIEVEEVPKSAMEVAREALPGITFDEAWTNVDGDDQLHSYEIRGRNAETGKIREVRVSPSGEILEME